MVNRSISMSSRVWITGGHLVLSLYCILSGQDKLTLFWGQWFGVLSTRKMNWTQSRAPYILIIPANTDQTGKAENFLKRGRLLGFSLEKVQHLTWITCVVYQSHKNHEGTEMLSKFYNGVEICGCIVEKSRQLTCCQAWLIKTFLIKQDQLSQGLNLPMWKDHWEKPETLQ